MTATAPALPVDLAAEEHVLGAMMLDRSTIITCSEILAPGDFYRESNGKLFKAIVDVDLRDQPADPITVADYLETHSLFDGTLTRQRLTELAAIVPSVGNAPHHARIVHDLAQLRSLIRAGGEIQRLGYERPGELADLIDRAEQLVLDIATQRDQGELEHAAASLQDTYRLMLSHQGHEITGLTTGLRELDELTAGLQPGNLVVIAGRPSMGKSALAIGIARAVVNQQQPVALFSLEMSKIEVDQRLLSHTSGVPLTRIRKPKHMGVADWSAIHGAAAELSDLPLYIDDSGGVRITELRSRARRLQARQPDLALIVVDYLQLMVAEQKIENRVQEVAQISRGLKQLARDLNVPVIALSQLSRQVEQRVDKRPILSDLRDSGAIEQDADLVVFVYRDEVYHRNTDKPGVAELIVAKHRNGPTDLIEVAWEKRLARFTNA